MNEIIRNDHLTNNVLFEKELTAKPNKSVLIKQLEKRLSDTDFSFSTESHLRAVTIVNFLSIIRRYLISKLKTFNDLLRISTYFILHENNIEEIDI